MNKRKFLKTLLFGGAAVTTVPAVLAAKLRADEEAKRRLTYQLAKHHNFALAYGMTKEEWVAHIKKIIMHNKQRGRNMNNIHAIPFPVNYQEWGKL